MTTTTNMIYRIKTIDTTTKMFDPTLMRFRQAQIRGESTCGALNCSALTSQNSISCGTNPIACGALACGSLSSSGVLFCGTNSVTCGDFVCSGFTSSDQILTNENNQFQCNAVTCSSVNASGAVMVAGQSTCGALSCNALNLSTNLTCSGYAMTCGAMTIGAGGARFEGTSCNANYFVSSSSYRLFYDGMSRGMFVFSNQAGEHFIDSNAGDLCIMNLETNRLVSFQDQIKITASNFKSNHTGGCYTTSGEILVSGRLGNGTGATVYEQGAHLQWNCVDGTGISYIFNQRGGGAGGISIGKYETVGGYSEQMLISTAGDVTMQGPITAPSFSSSGNMYRYANLAKTLTVPTGVVNQLLSTNPAVTTDITSPHIFRVILTCYNNGSGNKACGTAIWYSFTAGSGTSPAPVLCDLGSTNLVWSSYNDGTYCYLGYNITGAGNVNIYTTVEKMPYL